LNREVDTGPNEFALMQMNLLNLHEYVGVSKIYDYPMNLLSFINVLKCMLSLMLNRYIFDFVLTDGNECGQILTEGSAECVTKIRLLCLNLLEFVQ
jgi:hypothetical protein